MHIAEQGDGPLVLLLHGWPETWYSWRHQIDALSAAGYRVVAPDQRGYGATGRPDAVDQYSIFHLVGDVVALIHALEEDQVAVVGHDWGSIVASNTAVLRPDVVRGLVCVSIPPIPRGPLPPMTLTEQRFGKGFYQNYFQEPGVAEASLEKDVAATFRLALSGVRNPEPSEGFLGLFVEREALPDWLTEEALATFVEQFTASGFAGGLNWYRNFDRNWEQTTAWQDVPITAPTLCISGENDAMRVVYPLNDAVRAIVPDLRGVVDVPDCAHWTQQERPDLVTAALLDFLGGL
jgi:pimeloyl-ACP methyl ester carboxylesterase